MPIMTNEELVSKIQNEGLNLYEQLWSQTEDFANAQARKFYFSYELRCKQMCVEIEDLYQIGYLALLKAVKTFKNEAGRCFIGWFAYYLSSDYRKAIKIDNKNWQNNLINQAKEISDDIERTLTDERDLLEELIDKVYLEKISSDVNKALMCLTPSQRDTIVNIYFIGLTYQACAEKQGVTKGAVARSAQRAFAHLREDLEAYRLEAA